LAQAQRTSQAPAMAFKGPSGAVYSFDIQKSDHEYKVQRLNQQDLDRNFCLATTNIFKWMQAARMELPWMQAGYRAFSEVEPQMTRRLLVASQIIKLLRPGALSEAVDNPVTTHVRIGDIGRTSLEFRYKIYFGDIHVADASTVMIATAGTPGKFKPAPVPDDVKALAASDESSVNRLMRSSLAEMPKEPPADAYIATLVVRYSDEDVNKHANHSAQARFFEDAKEAVLQDEKASPVLRGIAEQQLDTIIIAYTAEVRAMDQLEIKVGTSAASALDVWVTRVLPNPGKVAHGRMICRGGSTFDSDKRRMRSSDL